MLYGSNCQKNMTVASNILEVSTFKSLWIYWDRTTKLSYACLLLLNTVFFKHADLSCKQDIKTYRICCVLPSFLSLYRLLFKMWMMMNENISSPAKMALCAWNFWPATHREQSVNLEFSHKSPSSSASLQSGTFTMFIVFWPEMFTESCTTLT